MRRVFLKNLQANSGFLENVMVPFSKQLTCIIGARGTCKSTVVESVRFAFNSDEKLIAKITDQEGMISKTLGSGSIRCEVEVVEDGTSSQYVIDREMALDPECGNKTLGEMSVLLPKNESGEWRFPDPDAAAKDYAAKVAVRERERRASSTAQSFTS